MQVELLLSVSGLCECCSRDNEERMFLHESVVLLLDGTSLWVWENLNSQEVNELEV